MGSSAHVQWMAAWDEAAVVEDAELRDTLHRRLGTVSGELKIGAQADPKTRRASLELIRQVRQQAAPKPERKDG